MKKFTAQTGWLAVLKAMYAPSHTSYDVLTVYEIRRGEPVRESMCLTRGMLMGSALFACGVALVSPYASVCLAPFFLLWVYSTFSRWRLVWAISTRLANAISERRQTGDWELLRLTPVPMVRWLMIQLVAVGWQVWSLVKALILIQAILASAYAMILLIEVSSSTYRMCLSEPCSQRISGMSFLFLGLPILVIWIAVPVIEAGMTAALSGFISSLSRYPPVVVATSLISMMTMRVLLILLGWAVMSLLYNDVAVQMGWLEQPAYTWREPAYTRFPTIPEIIVLAVFWEWIPAVALGELGTNYGDSTEHAATYLVIFGTLFFTYAAVPLGVMHLFFQGAVRRLESEEA